MSLSTDDVRKIARLARLQIRDDELPALTQDLDNILTLVAQMDQANTDDVQPMAHPLDRTQPMRKDQVSETNQREQFQQNAPQTQAGLYMVPKVIDEE